MKNTVSLIGMVGSDPELRSTANSKQVCNISLCTSEKWKNEAGETIENKQWHKLVIWGRSAEIANEYIKKGDRLAIDGRIEYRHFVNKEGQKQYATDIIVSEFFLIQPKS